VPQSITRNECFSNTKKSSHPDGKKDRGPSAELENSVSFWRDGGLKADGKSARRLRGRQTLIWVRGLNGLRVRDQNLGLEEKTGGGVSSIQGNSSIKESKLIDFVGAPERNATQINILSTKRGIGIRKVELRRTGVTKSCRRSPPGGSHPRNKK